MSGPGTTPQFSMFVTMRRHIADFSRMVDQQRAYRRTVLDAVTPEHRRLLSQLVSDLIVAPNPDLVGTIRRLDSALSSQEAQRIVALDREHQAAMVRDFQEMAAETRADMGRAAYEPPMPLHRPQMPLRPPPLSYVSPVSPSAPFGNDAASILVRTAATTLMMPNVVFGGLSPLNVTAPAR